MMWSSLPRKERSSPEDPDAIELAYQLQNLTAIDFSILKRIINRYGEDVYRWVEILMYSRMKAEPSREQVLPEVRSVFEYAIQHTDQFSGNQSILDWLFSIGIHHVKKSKVNKSKDIKKHSPDDQGFINTKTESSKPLELEKLGRLRGHQFRAIILRYFFQLKLTDISQICNSSISDTHEKLNLAREKLFDFLPQTHLSREIQAYSDGLLDNDTAELDRVNEHLASCTACQQAYSELDNLETNLTKDLQELWEPPHISNAEINQIIEAISQSINQPNKTFKQVVPFRQAAWLMGFIVVLVGITMLSIRLIPIDSQLAQQDQVTENQPHPLSLVNSGSIEHVDVQANRAPLYIAPAFSNDGNWGVFTASTYNQHTRGIIDRSIYLYNREAGDMQLINKSSGADSTWVWWDLTPSISADGQWIVFVTSTNASGISGIPCETRKNHSCLDIMLYNRISGTTRRLTRGIDGGPANGDSLAPTISGDGKWIAFWSTADNLVDSTNNTCQNNENSFTCLNIYLYSLGDGKVERIPVQMAPGDSVYGVDRISLSANARYVAFTVTSTMQPNGLEGLSALAKRMYHYPYGQQSSNNLFPLVINSSEAIVYDRENGTYEFCNITQDGIFGNGASSSPILSGDGRYVVFVSKSTNLIPGDTNYNSEVLVRDRSNGKLEMVSVDSNGNQSNNDNGLTFMERGYFSVNISDDGRYVVFESSANNLGPSINPDCNNIGYIRCVYLYVHDRSTGTTKAVSALPNQDFTLLPGISSDGRWISYMEYSHECSSTQLRCSNVMLYDQQSGWTSNVTQFGEQAPRLSWQYSGSIVLPWQSWESGAMAVSPDNKLIATGGIDSTVRIWQSSKVNTDNTIETADYIFSVGGTKSFSSLAFSKDGKWLAAGTTGGSVYIWDVATQQEINHFSDITDLIRNLTFSPDNTDLIIASAKQVWVLNIARNQLASLNSDLFDPSGIYEIAISPNANLIATARKDGTIWVQNLPGGQLINRMGPYKLSINSLGFSQDGTMLAASRSDGTINIWQINQSAGNATSITPYNQFPSFVTTGRLVFSPDNEYLAATGIIGEVPIWNTDSGTLFDINLAIPNEMVYGLKFMSDNQSLAVEYETKLDVWDISSQKTPEYFTRASLDSFVDSNPFQYGTVNDLPHWHDRMRDFTQVFLDLSQAASQVSFPLIIPGKLPDDFTFLSAVVNTDGSVWLSYVANISEGRQEFINIYERDTGSTVPPVMVIGAGAEVNMTQIGTDSGLASAEYVQGDWLLRRSFTSPSDGSTTGISHFAWYWNPESLSEHFRWQQDGILIGLYYQPYSPYSPRNNNYQSFSILSTYKTLLSQNDLEQVASGMTRYYDSSISTQAPPSIRANTGY